MFCCLFYMIGTRTQELLGLKANNLTIKKSYLFAWKKQQRNKTNYLCRSCLLCEYFVKNVDKSKKETLTYKNKFCKWKHVLTVTFISMQVLAKCHNKWLRILKCLVPETNLNCLYIYYNQERLKIANLCCLISSSCKISISNWDGFNYCIFKKY